MHVATFFCKFVETTAKFLVSTDAACHRNVLYARCFYNFFKSVHKLRNGAFLKTCGNIRARNFLAFLFEIMNLIYDKRFEPAITEIQVI